jgi:hypothetical protein
MTAVDVADAFRSGGAATMGTLPFAEQVRLTHVPPAATDGPIPGALLADVSRSEAEAMARALGSELDRAVDVTVEGANVRMRSAVRGTLADGTAVDYSTEVVLGVAGGEIVSMEAHLDEVSMAQHRRVLDAGGFERPG